MLVRPLCPATMTPMLFDAVARQVARTIPEPVRDWMIGHRVEGLPDLEIVPSTIAKWWIDESLLQQEIAMNRLRLPSTDFRRRLRGELSEALDLFGDQGWLRDPRSYHVDPPTPTGTDEPPPHPHQHQHQKRISQPSHARRWHRVGDPALPRGGFILHRRLDRHPPAQH